jgi:hypothetical protein
MTGRHQHIAHFDICATCGRHGHATAPSGKIGPEVASRPQAYESFELMRRNKTPGVGMAGASLLRTKVPLDWPTTPVTEEKLAQIITECEEIRHRLFRHETDK